MAGMVRIEPVPPASRDKALALLREGATRGGGRQPTGYLRSLLAGSPASRCKLWWARTLRGPRAAAMTIRNPGRTASVLYGAGRSCPGRVLSGLIARASDAVLTEDLAFTQVMLHPARLSDADALLAAGYVRLAELVYLRRDLTQPPQPPEAGELDFRALAPGEQRRLEEIIEDTYVDSTDCPLLRGLRRMEDVVAGHKSSGRFRPQSWWIPARAGEAVGCVLVNDSADDADAGEIVYLGVRPRFRRRGFARAMLRHALADAFGRGRSRVNLAVDVANAPAVQLYRGEGFRATDRRCVYIKPRPGQPPVESL